MPSTMSNTTNYRLKSSHGNIAVEEAGTGELALLFLHGNSSCRKIFQHQLTGPLARTFRLIAFDLPGHGESDDAVDPGRTYSRPGFADCAVEVLRTLGVSSVAVFGWSLGGHIAIEMMARLPGLRGLMISGTPAFGRGEAALGFRSSHHMALARKRHLTDREAMEFADGMTGGAVEPFLLAAISRADGKAREFLFRARDADAGIDQRLAVESNPAPLAVVNGAGDSFINLDFVDQIAYANLWEGRCHRLPGHGHAAFWSGPRDFNPILERFMAEVGGLGGCHRARIQSRP